MRRIGNFSDSHSFAVREDGELIYVTECKTNADVVLHNTPVHQRMFQEMNKAPPIDSVIPTLKPKKPLPKLLKIPKKVWVYDEKIKHKKNPKVYLKCFLNRRTTKKSKKPRVVSYNHFYTKPIDDHYDPNNKNDFHCELDHCLDNTYNYISDYESNGDWSDYESEYDYDYIYYDRYHRYDNDDEW